MIPFYFESQIDCFNCIYARIAKENGEMSCAEKHEYPKPYEQCQFYKNEYQQRIEIIENWLHLGGLSEERKQQVLEWKKEYEQKNREMEETDRTRRMEEKEIHERGIDAVYKDSLIDDN